MDDPVEEVLALFAERGSHHCGEVVDQLRHGTQSAALAVEAGASDAQVVSALLHDIGHLLGAGDGSPGDVPRPADDRHESVGARWLHIRFGADVAAPVALHVLAKRYRSAVDGTYDKSLSPTSRATLGLQGGPLDPAGVVRFARCPWAGDTLALRSWDEEAKDPAVTPVGMEEFLPVLRRVADQVRPGRPPVSGTSRPPGRT